MVIRRIILILCIIAMLPTTVDPSCIGYYMYSNEGLAVLLDDGDAAEDDGAMTDTDRPAEGLAATRIPAQVSIEPQAIIDLWLRLVVTVPVRVADHQPESAPDFLAPALRTSFLRNAVLLI